MGESKLRRNKNKGIKDGSGEKEKTRSCLYFPLN
jgi:hypothetical protein